MKRPVAISLFVVVLVTSSLLLLGMKTADTDSSRSVTATGTATVSAVPDSARLYLAVSTTGKTPTEARRENAKRITEVRAALLALKLPNLKTKTLDVTVSKVLGKAKHDDDSRPLIGFEVKHAFTVLRRRFLLAGPRSRVRSA